MASLNRITIIGNLGSDVTLRQAGGKSVADFSVAVNDKRGGKEETTWFRVSCWEKQAETCAQFLAKGSAVHVTGRVKLHEYVAKDGTPKASLEVTAEPFGVIFLGGKGGGAGDAPPRSDGSGFGSNSEIPF